MFFIYQLLMTLIIFISPLIIIIRLLKGKEHVTRFKEKFCFFSKKNNYKNLIWFHGSSVGELMSVIPIIIELEKNKKIDQILVTSSTLSSSKVIKNFKFKKVIHQFYPIDHNLFTEQFLEYWKPNIAFFIDSEIWPSMFKKLEDKNVPLVLLNARITKKSFNRWLKIKKFSNSIFNKIKIAYPANKETEYYLKKLNVKKINFIGNLKFIKNNAPYKEGLDKINLLFKKYKIWAAASTHENEEIIIAKAHIKLKKKIGNLITIIIPRHIERVNSIISDIEKLNLKIISHSLKKRDLKKTDIYIVDTYGESKKFLKNVPTVFIGKSLTKTGGHNPLEAAHYGAKILHGPNTENFEDIYKLLKSLKISKEVKNVNQLINSITFKKNSKKGFKIEKFGQIILKKTIKNLNILIKNEI